jgi:predicted permease
MTASPRPDRPSSPSWPSWPARVYGLLLLAYPAHFRVRFGEAMRGTFQREYARVRGAGRVSLLPFWIGTIAQACWFGICERVRSRPQYRGRALVTDLRYAIRLLARAPLFTATSVASLAIGIAASTIVFGVADALFFRAPPGVRDAERLVDIARTTDRTGYGPILYPAFRHVREHTRTLESIAAVTRTSLALSLQHEGATVRVYGQTVSASFFDVLRMQPAIGRFFRADEDEMRNPRAVVVVSHRFWRDQLHADPAALARPLRINDLPFDVIGVAAPGFDGTTIIGSDVWVPMAMASTLRGASRATAAPASSIEPGADWNDEWAIARLAPDVTREMAQAELNLLLDALKADTPAIPRSHGFVVDDAGSLPPRARPMFAAFVGLVGALAVALLAIACSNVAGMLLVRADHRRHEIATRVALGASRGQVIAQLLVETLVLFATGGVVALPLAWWLASALQAFLPQNLPIPIRFELAVTTRTVLFAIGTSLLTALLFGLAPARHALQANLSQMFNGRSTSSRERRRLQRGLVVAQVALSLAMVITAGLFVRTLHAASRIDSGFRTADIMAIAIDTTLADASGPNAAVLVDRLVTQLRGIAGVEAVAHGRIVPLEGNSASLGAVRVPGSTGTIAQRGVDWDVVSPTYFAVVGLTLVDGRAFTAADREGQPHVAIVNEAFARAAWPDRSAIGQRFWRMTDERGQREGEGESLEVVGVARDAMYRSLSERPRPFVYVPFAQHPQTHVELFVKHAPGLSIGREVRAAISRVEPRLPIIVMRSFDEATMVTLIPQRFAAWMAGSIGSIGIFLAALGLYGVVAFLVAQQRREIAIRMALGASHHDVRAAVLGQAARLGAIGAGVGLLIAWALGRLIQSQSLLLGVQPTDPLTFGGFALLMSLVLFAASYLPARRAAATDPAAALRAQ